MFKTVERIRMSDTDTTGVIYFAEQLRFCQEALEKMVASEGIDFGDFILRSEFYLPIVHAASNYLSPLFIGDEVTIEVRLQRIGKSSFTLHFKLKKGEEVAGDVSIVWVTVLKTTRRPSPVPKTLRALLEKLERV